MPDEINSDAVHPSPADSGDEAKPITPEAPGDDELGPLKRAYERTKEELKEAKARAKKAEILDQLEAGGISAADLPAKLAQLKAQAEQEEILNQKIAEIQAQARAEQQQIEERYLNQLKERDTQIAQTQRQRQLESVLAETGAPASAYGDFEALAARYIEFDENNAIKSFKTPTGEAFYVDDDKQAGKVRPANTNDFVIAAKKGEYGPALQALLPAFNQSSGSGISSAGGIGGDGVLTFTQAEVNSPEWPANLPPEKMDKVKAKQYRVI
jgi:antirestriction protein